MPESSPRVALRVCGGTHASPGTLGRLRSDLLAAHCAGGFAAAVWSSMPSMPPTSMPSFPRPDMPKFRWFTRRPGTARCTHVTVRVAPRMRRATRRSVDLVMEPAAASRPRAGSPTCAEKPSERATSSASCAWPTAEP